MASCVVVKHRFARGFILRQLKCNNVSIEFNIKNCECQYIFVSIIQGKRGQDKLFCPIHFLSKSKFSVGKAMCLYWIKTRFRSIKHHLLRINTIDHCK